MAQHVQSRTKTIALALIVAMALSVAVLPVTASAAQTADPSRLIAIAKQYVGSPYDFGGTTPSGFDASGYVQYVYKQVGIELPRLVRNQAQAGTPVSKSNLQAGDLVYFTINSSTPNMIGIYVEGTTFLAASSAAGQVDYRDLASSLYSRNYAGARRVIDGGASPSPIPAPPEQKPDPKPTPDPAPEPAPNALADKIVTFAKTKLGTPYRFGANGPNAFDCSSFTKTVFAKFGISIPRTSLSQSKVGTYVSKDKLQKGDLVFFKDTYKAGVSHVGIYIGNNQFIHAWPRTGVKISKLSERYFVDHWWGAKRVIR